MRTLASTVMAGSLLFMSKPGCVYSEETRQPAAASLQWRFDYDDAGRLSKLVDPAGKETKIHYKLDEQERVQPGRHSDCYLTRLSGIRAR